MPVIKSAKKKLRQDKKRTLANKNIRELLKELIKKAKKEAGSNSAGEIIKQAVQAADKAAKNHIIHKNKAAHIKSALSKLLSKSTPKEKKVTKTTKLKTTKKAIK